MIRSNAIKSLLYSLNGRYYQVSIQVFMIVVALHFLEHVTQMAQLYLLHWTRSDCLGLLGLVYPWLMRSEWLHYGHALFMLLGLYLLRMGLYSGFWWDCAMWFAFYHWIEHSLLLGESIYGIPLPSRWSIGSFLLPRIELHFLYNLIALVLVLLAMKKHSPTKMNA